MNEQVIASRIVALDDCIDNLIELRSARVSIELQQDEFQQNRQSGLKKGLGIAAGVGGAAYLGSAAMRGKGIAGQTMASKGHGIGKGFKGSGVLGRTKVQVGQDMKKINPFKKKKLNGEASTFNPVGPRQNQNPIKDPRYNIT